MEINVFMSNVDQVSEIIEHSTFNRKQFVTNYAAHIPFPYVH